MATATISAIEKSNMPAAKKSAFMRILDGGQGLRERGSMFLSQSKRQLESGATAAREVAESGAAAIAMAAVDVYNSNGGLDFKGKVPIDGVIAVAGVVGSIVAAGHDAAPTLRNIGRGTADVFFFRKAHVYFTEKHLANTGTVPNSTVAPGPASGSPAAGPSAAPVAAPTMTGGAGSAPGFGNEDIRRVAGRL